MMFRLGLSVIDRGSLPDSSRRRFGGVRLCVGLPPSVVLAIGYFSQHSIDLSWNHQVL